MKVNYKKEFQHSYMILTSEEAASENSYKERMLEHHCIRSLLPCRIQEVDGNALYYYDITSFRAVQTLYEEGSMTLSLLQMIFEGILRLLTELPEYLLSADQIILTGESVFVNLETHTVRFLYYPEKEGEFQNGFREFLEEIMPFVNHKEPEEQEMVYHIYTDLVQNRLTIDRMQEILFTQTLLQKKEAEEQREDLITTEEQETEWPVDEVELRQEKAEDLISLYALFGTYIALSGILILAAVGMYYHWIPRISVVALLGGFLGLITLVSIVFAVHHKRRIFLLKLKKAEERKRRN